MDCSFYLKNQVSYGNTVRNKTRFENNLTEWWNKRLKTYPICTIIRFVIIMERFITPYSGFNLNRRLES